MDVERILKVKVKAGLIQVAWVARNGDEYDVKFRAAARPEFHASLEAVVQPVLKWLELPEAYGQGMVVSGVTYSNANDVMGAVVTLAKGLKDADAPLIVNTPHAPSRPYAEGSGGKLLPGEVVEALEAVSGEATRYLQGDRAQMSLFGQAPAKEVV
jgi:hypothetical protein